ncbi:MAG: DUF362 domain-containing protein [bacterium]|nr:DUF362 domain-containing protein [bacterium]
MMPTLQLENNPFLPDPARPSVFVTSGNGPYKNTRTALAQLDLSPVKGKRVLLKPNAGRVADPGSGIVTDPQVVAAAIDAFAEAGAEVAIGESPIVGVDTLEAFEAMGVAAAAAERNCPLIDMDKRPFVEMSIPDGLALHEIKLCPEVFEFDFIVSLPVMKMHMHTGVTLAVKNMKGCLWRRSKVELHMLPPVEGREEKPIDIAIADMSSVLRPHLAIVDGTVGMEGLGPSAGQAKPLGVVVLSADPFAADAAACRLMGSDARDIAHLRIGGEERGYGVIDLEQLCVTPEDWQESAVTFACPPENLSIEFPGIEVLDNVSCSACQSTLLLFIKRYGKQLGDYFPEDEPVHFAIGKGHDEVPEETFCIGNCTARHRQYTHFIPGCPPVASQILSAVSHQPSVDRVDGHVEQEKNVEK